MKVLQRMHFNFLFKYQTSLNNQLIINIHLILAPENKEIGISTLNIENLNENVWISTKIESLMPNITGEIIITVSRSINLLHRIFGFRYFTREEIANEMKIISSHDNITVWSFVGKDGKKYVCKSIPKPDINEILPIFPRPIHPCMIELEGYHSSEHILGFIFLFASRGSLLDIIRTGMKIAERRKLAFEIISCLDQMNSEGFIHRDIKPGNILVSDNNMCLVCDFGLSRSFTGRGETTQDVGTNMYQAPEVFKSNKYDYLIDVYSTGKVLNEMGFNSIVFSETMNEKPENRPNFYELSQAFVCEFFTVDLLMFSMTFISSLNLTEPYFRNDYQYYLKKCIERPNYIFHAAFMLFSVSNFGECSDLMKLGELVGVEDCKLFYNLLKAIEAIAFDSFDVDIEKCSHCAFKIAEYYIVGFPTPYCQLLKELLSKRTRGNWFTDKYTKHLNDDAGSSLVEKIMKYEISNNNIFQSYQSLEYLMSLAENGNEQAAYYVASTFFIYQKYEEAKYWLEKSMKNNLDGGKCLMYGKILEIEQNYKALDYYKMALDYEIGNAGFQIYNFCLKRGDNEKAIEYLKRGAELGDSSCKAIYGLYLGDEGHKLRIEAANDGNPFGHYSMMMEYLEKDIETAFYHGIIFLSQKNDKEALLNLDKACESCKYVNGVRYCHQKLIEFNLSTDFFLRAFDRYNDCSMILFNIYFGGAVCQEHLDKAMNYLEIAAEMMISEALLMLSLLFKFGKIVEKDIEKSNFYYELVDKDMIDEHHYKKMMKILKSFETYSDDLFDQDGDFLCLYALLMKNSYFSEESIEIAKELLKLSAEKGNKESELHLFHIEYFERLLKL